MEKRIKFIGDTNRTGIINDVLNVMMTLNKDVLAVEFSHYIFIKIRWDETLKWQ